MTTAPVSPPAPGGTGVSTAPRLDRALDAWGTGRFEETLREELMRLDRRQLPLDKGTAQGGFVGDDDIGVMIIRFSDRGRFIHAEIGVFFTEIVINCGCGDDPYETSAYCVLGVDIDKASAEAEFSILPD